MCLYLVEVVFDGVDFVVVGYYVVGVGEVLFGEGVGGKVLVNDGEC